MIHPPAQFGDPSLWKGSDAPPLWPNDANVSRSTPEVIPLAPRSPTDPDETGHIRWMRVGVVDLGGNTARLLVATSGEPGLERIVEERVVLGLGADIERRGRISKSKLAATASAVAWLHSRASDAGCTRVEVLVTSPGRQSANRGALERSLARVSRKCIRFISSDEEARLAYAGAIACAPIGYGDVAVCDVGGGSTEIAIGSPAAQPAWCRSFDLGSLRISQRYFHDVPPKRRELEAARASVRTAFAALDPAPPATTRALASGGTARALRRIVGDTLGPDELREALAIVTSAEPRKIARNFDLPTWRARILPGGTLVLSEIQVLLGVPLHVADGGIREGAALSLLARAAAAT